ncbi:MAG: UbiA family prenyltransferase [Candidatus Micrarchaeota archaeon]|nr:UbiA family prenyltransferase [Candidatus Micrarchaeota archaeon]
MDKKLLSVFEFLRIDHAIIVALVILIGLAENFKAGFLSISTDVIAIFVAIPFFITLYSFGLNDLVDIRTDIENKRKDRPLANNLITLEEAKLVIRVINVILLLLFLAGMYLALSTPYLLFVLGICLIFHIFSILYSFFLKDMYVIGNAYIAFTMAIPFAYSGIVALNITTAQKLLFVIAFLVGLSREIIKSIQDMEGDKKTRKSKTLPIVLGAQNSYRLAFWFIATSLLIALINLFVSAIILIEPLNSINVLISIVLVITLGYLYLYSINLNVDDLEKLEKFRQLTKNLMFINVIFYLVCVVIGVPYT